MMPSPNEGSNRADDDEVGREPRDGESLDRNGRIRPVPPGVGMCPDE